MSAIPEIKKRIAITEIERKSLRAHQTAHPSLTRKELINWFASEFGREISSSSISESLSEKYSAVDNAEATGVKRKRGPQWVRLEDSLFEFWNESQPRDVTGKELKIKAAALWPTIPGAHGKKVPSFSDGWLNAWRVRHGLAQPRKPNEVLNIDTTASNYLATAANFVSSSGRGLIPSPKMFPLIRPNWTQYESQSLDHSSSSSQPYRASDPSSMSQEASLHVESNLTPTNGMDLYNWTTSIPNILGSDFGSPSAVMDTTQSHQFHNETGNHWQGGLTEKAMNDITMSTAIFYSDDTRPTKRRRTSGQHTIRRLDGSPAQSFGVTSYSISDAISNPSACEADRKFDDGLLNGISDLMRWFTMTGSDHFIKENDLKIIEPILIAATIAVSGQTIHIPSDVGDHLRSSSIFRVTSQTAAAKAIRHFMSSDVFQLQETARAVSFPQDTILSDYDRFCTEITRSPTPETAAAQQQQSVYTDECRASVQSPISIASTSLEAPRICHDNSLATDSVRPTPQNFRRVVTFFSSTAKDGRFDIITQTRTPRTAASSTIDAEEVAEEDFSATIIITPFASTHHLIPQIKLELSSLLSTPKISCRTIIPYSSEIFEIASFGTPRELEIVLSRGDASLTNCDPEGRSLLNYALSSRNISTVEYLSAKVEDIDNYELSIIGHETPLLGCLFTNDVEIDGYERDRITTCVKIMLSAGADPSLLQSMGPNSFTSVYSVMLSSSSIETVRACLDQGQPFISSKFSSADDPNPSPLLTTIKQYSYFGGESFQMNEKVLFLLERGADTKVRDSNGRTCLHLAFMFSCHMTWIIYAFALNSYNEHEFKSILMSMVVAGADIYAEDKHGLTVSEVACGYGHEEVWIEVLAECGYDPRAVFCLHELCTDLQSVPGMGVFSTVAPVVRPTKLSFREHCEQQKSIYRPPPKEKHWFQVQKEYRYLRLLVGDSSDSEDYETDDEDSYTEDEELYSEDGKMKDQKSVRTMRMKKGNSPPIRINMTAQRSTTNNTRKKFMTQNMAQNGGYDRLRNVTG